MLGKCEVCVANISLGVKKGVNYDWDIVEEN